MAANVTSWKSFLSKLQAETEHQGTVLLERLKNFKTAPDIFWYPGSGQDMVPLLLDVPNNPTHRRLYRIDQDSEEMPILFWMNDRSSYSKDFPNNNLLGREIVPSYSKLWNSYGSRLTIGTSKECYSFEGNIQITLFTANVRNKEQGVHSRVKSGDTYLICISYCDSELLLEKVFSSYGLHLYMIALIKQGGFSGQRQNFQHYTDLPEKVTQLEKQIGKVDFWVIDEYGQNRYRFELGHNKKMPIARSLRDYEYIGGPLRWGWPPARLFGKPGVEYSPEKRPFRKGRSWWNDLNWE